MIKLILIILFLSPGPTNDCDEIFEKFISANSFDRAPEGNEGFLLHLNVKTEFSKKVNGRLSSEEEVIAIIHDEGFCVKTNQLLNIGDGNELFVIIPQAKTIVISQYDKQAMPSMMQVLEHQNNLINQADDKKCNEVEIDGKIYISLSMKFSAPVLLQNQLVQAIEYLVDPESYSIIRSSMFYAPGQSIKKQIINYLQFDKNNKKANAPTSAMVYAENGKLRNEFLHYEIIKK